MAERERLSARRPAPPGAPPHPIPSGCPALAPNPPQSRHEWPSSRYFQVHFEHLQSTLALLRQEVEAQRRLLLDLHRQVALVQRGRDIPEPAPMRFTTQ